MKVLPSIFLTGNGGAENREESRTMALGKKMYRSNRNTNDTKKYKRYDKARPAPLPQKE